jgi:hypothetical protein
MNLYDKTSAYYAKRDDKKLRELLRKDYGKYRITKDNDVHIYGKMPNSIKIGWWLLGDKIFVMQDYCI